MNTERTSIFLIANLGAEVSRIFSAKEKGNHSLFKSAMDRARKIILELKSLPDTKNNEEINILEDVIEDIGKGCRKYQISPEQLGSFFYPFAKIVMQTQ